jgi:hypothetical protein
MRIRMVVILPPLLVAACIKTPEIPQALEHGIADTASEGGGGEILEDVARDPGSDLVQDSGPDLDTFFSEATDSALDLVGPADLGRDTGEVPDVPALARLQAGAAVVFAGKSSGGGWALRPVGAAGWDPARLSAGGAFSLRPVVIP